MLAGGHVVADGTLEQVQNADHPVVRAFFDRVASVAYGERQSLLASLSGEERP
jgi:ABC-type transporter Mla maintaining outer membrane lipid asymmetry ATPase subunit MlaF